jgi:hypothetical protein
MASITVDRHVSAQVRQGKRIYAIAPVIGPQYGEEDRVTVNRQQLPVAQSPTAGRKVPGKQTNFTGISFNERHNLGSFQIVVVNKNDDN